jgi:hypothetical protein
VQFEDFPNHESLDGHLEYSMIVGRLHVLFDQAVSEQEEAGRFQMFTIMGMGHGVADPLVRFRIMDERRAGEDLRGITGEATIDVALPVEDFRVSHPRLREDANYFVVFVPAAEGEESAILVREGHAQDDLTTLQAPYPDFMVRVLAATPVSLRKNSL